jgi:hypothetical protein
MCSLHKEKYQPTPASSNDIHKKAPPPTYSYPNAMMDSKEDFEHGSIGNVAGAIVIDGEFPSDLSDGIIPPSSTAGMSIWDGWRCRSFPPGQR